MSRRKSTKAAARRVLSSKCRSLGKAAALLEGRDFTVVLESEVRLRTLKQKCCLNAAEALALLKAP